MADADFTIPTSSDLSLIGEYTATIKSEISVPDDYTMNTYSAMTVSYDFLIRVQPCQINTYSRNLVAGPIYFNIAAPGKTDGAYSFGEEPICNYDETVTVTNLPVFVTHNSGTADFTLSQISDLSLIGEYIVTIRSEICVPNDYTKSGCTVMADEYQFSIFVAGCLVTNYYASTKVTRIDYNIGSPSLTDGFYEFEEDPACNYPEKVTVTNLPAFVTHNEASSDFTIPYTGDLSLLGEYVVTIRSEICVPDDHT